MEKVTVNLISEASSALEDTAILLQMSKTDIINRALQIYSYIEFTTRAEGSQFLIQRSNGKIDSIDFDGETDIKESQ